MEEEESGLRLEGDGRGRGDLTLIILEMPNSKFPLAQYSVPMTA
jgi:hypothetical protein